MKQLLGKLKQLRLRGKEGTAIPRNLCCPYLLLKFTVGAKRRILVYTEKSLYKHVMSSKFGKLAKNDGIEIKLVEL